MGKGSRNRQLHLQDKMDHPEKYKEKKHAPKWLTPVISLVVVAAILIGVIASFITNSGIIKRNNVLLESQTGKYDINQNMATFIAWQEIYYSAYTYWYYCSYGIYEDTDEITTTFSSADQYALTVAQLSLKENLRDCIDDIMDSLKIYIAVCDEAERNGVKLESADMEEVNESIKELKSMQTGYGYASFDGFLKTAMGSGIKEKDLKSALKLVTLYNKYTEQMQVTYEKAVTLDDLKAFRDENPDDYFKIDYLTFTAGDKELADKLKACETAEEFKALVLENHLAENYKAAYNKYTTTVKAEEELASVSGKTNENNGTALTDALNAINAEAAKDFKKDDDFTGKTELKDWLFSTSRKQYDTDVLTTENGVYLVAFLSEKASTDTVNARVKFYEFVEGESNGEDADFKKNILEHITQSKAETPSYPTVDYKKASKNADELKAQLEAVTGDALTQLLKDKNAVEKKDVTSGTSSTSTLPEAVIKEATASTVKAGDILIANSSNTYYVIYVSDVTDGKTDLSYVTVEGDLYYLIIDDLTASLDKVYPTVKNTLYVSDAEEGTFESWISALTDKDQAVSSENSARKEGDTNYFEVKDEDDKVTGYNAYMVINTPLYLDTAKVVKGGYLSFTESTFADDAKAALDTIKGKTDLELLNALSALDSAATVSTALKIADVTAKDQNLSDWLFSDERQANDTAVVTSKDGKSAYVAVFSEKAEQWASTAKTNYVTEKLQEWADALAEKYTPNEKGLNKLGEPTTTVDTTTAGEDTTTEPETEAGLNG